MSIDLRAPLGAMLALMLTSGSALAGAAVVSTDMTGRAGPGDNFEPVWTAIAGTQVDVHECDMRQWCRVDYRGVEGWVHVKGVDAKVKHAKVPGSPGGADAAEGGGETAKSGGGGGSRPRPGAGRTGPDVGDFVAAGTGKGEPPPHSDNKDSSVYTPAPTTPNDTGSNRRAASGQ